VECLAGAGKIDQLIMPSGKAFDSVKAFSDQNPDWLFGHFGYGLAGETEALPVTGAVGPAGFPDLHFFVPEILIRVANTHIEIGSPMGNHREIYEEIVSTPISAELRQPVSHAAIRSRFSRKEYLQTIRRIKSHILRGDCYELNFCQEFYMEDCVIDPLSMYLQLTEASPNPFSGFYRLDDSYLFCASPERYLKKTGSRLLSQPIKGTWQLDPAARNSDEENRLKLLRNAKERSENVMVVDLVRNDLAKVCKEGTVAVDELFGIYSFPNLHHMISSVTGELDDGLHWVDAVKATFPMGSMTGAPKRRVLELIERYERRGRGIFSGALGYVTPTRDFDFNVVIRSMIYEKGRNYLSFPVGSGITFYCDPEKEYEECLLKISAIKKVVARSEPLLFK